MIKALKKLILIMPSLIIIAGIFILSNQSKIDLPDIGLDFFDKLLHFAAYFVLGIALQMALYAFTFQLKDLAFNALIIGIGLLYAGLDEIHQSYIPGRDASLYDFFADAFGILASLIFNKFVKSRALKFINNNNSSEN